MVSLLVKTFHLVRLRCPTTWHFWHEKDAAQHPTLWNIQYYGRLHCTQPHSTTTQHTFPEANVEKPSSDHDLLQGLGTAWPDILRNFKSNNKELSQLLLYSTVSFTVTALHFHFTILTVLWYHICYFWTSAEISCVNNCTYSIFSFWYNYVFFINVWQNSQQMRQEIQCTSVRFQIIHGQIILCSKDQ